MKLVARQPAAIPQPGQQFGQWRIIDAARPGLSGEPRVKAECSCGRITKTVAVRSLLDQQRPSRRCQLCARDASKRAFFIQMPVKKR